MKNDKVNLPEIIGREEVRWLIRKRLIFYWLMTDLKI